MHDAEAGRGREGEEVLLRGEGGVGAEAEDALLAGGVEGLGELLEAGFAEVGEGGVGGGAGGGVVVFEGVEEGVFVVGGGGHGVCLCWGGVDGGGAGSSCARLVFPWRVQPCGWFWR